MTWFFITKKLDQYLLIEAKSHSIPLNVYFGDIIATKKHLQYLQSYWENKVSTRFEHLNKHLKDYNIGNNYKYIIVSKYPEILSHFSKFLVLSLEEYEYFLQNIHQDYNFEKIYENLYNIDSNTSREIEKFTKEFTNISFL